MGPRGLPKGYALKQSKVCLEGDLPGGGNGMDRGWLGQQHGLEKELQSIWRGWK